jgi:nitrogen fixation protein NifU and related proteins
MTEPGDLDRLYQATIIAHDRAPRHAGTLPDATHQATVDNPLCGDVVTVQARIIDGVVRDIAFEGRGCALSRAAASIMTTMVVDHDVASARALAAQFEHFVQSVPDAAIPDELGDLGAFAGVRRFRSRRGCALLAFHALLASLDRDR